MDKDPKNPLNLNFWSFCDAVNAANCRLEFSDSFKKMYGIKHKWDSFSPMPMDGDAWSIMNSLALPTSSFLEYVMFARMYVSALDNQMYDGHYSTTHCCLSLSKDKPCQSYQGTGLDQLGFSMPNIRHCKKMKAISILPIQAKL